MSDLTFDYLKLQEVDPNFTPVPRDVYTLKIVGTKTAPYTVKNGERAGEEGQRIEFQFGIVGHPTETGRKLYHSFFPGVFAQKALRRIMDATGVVQGDDMDFKAWLELIAQEQPEARYLVEVVDSKDKNGNVVKANQINFKEVHPVA